MPPLDKASYVLVLWDDRNDRPRGKTHALDCGWIDGFHWVKDGYRKVDVDDISDRVGRCGFCGGGPRPKGSTRERGGPRAPIADTVANALVDEPGSERVGARQGTTVRVRDERSDQQHTWTIVGPGQGDVARGRLSTDSPIAKALLGRVAGETVTAETPRGPRRYTITELFT